MSPSFPSTFWNVNMHDQTSCDYLGPSQSVVDTALVTPEDRTAVVDFCYGIANACDLDLDTVAMAMSTVDRFLSCPGDVARDALRDCRRFRLVAVAALSLFGEASGESGRSLAASVADVYASDEIGAMRAHIHRGLRGHVRVPTSLQIARRILSLALCVNLEESRWGFVLDLVQFQTEYAVSDYYFTTQLPSTLAVAAVLNAFDQITGRDRQTLRRALLRVLPTVVSENALSPEDLLAAKKRLQHVLEAEDCSDDATIVSETSTESFDQL